MKTKAHSQGGLSLWEVVLVLATIALVGFVALPMLMRSRRHTCHVYCTSQLRQIGLAFRLFSNDHGDLFPFAVSNADGGTLGFTNSPNVFLHFQAMSNELVSPKVLVCASDWNRLRATDFLNGPTTNSFSSNTNLSYFAGLDATESRPEQLLSGDRNITGGVVVGGFLRLLNPNTPAGWSTQFHTTFGNIGLADGSAMQMTPASLRAQLQVNDLDVIRLAIP